MTVQEPRLPAKEGELSRLELEAIVGTLPVLLFVLDERDVYVGYRFGGLAAPFVPPELFLGRGLAEVLPDPPGSELAEATARVRASGREAIVEYTLPFATGVRAYEARIVPLSHGRVGVLALEVTDRFQARDLLATRLRQQSASATLGQLAIRSGDLQEIMDAAVRAVVETLAVEHCVVIQRAPDGSATVSRAASGARPDPAGASIKIDIGGHDRSYGVLIARAAAPRVFTSDEGLFLETVAGTLAQAVERHRILARLRESEERFRLLIDRSADLIAVFSPEGIIRFMSASVENVLGYRPEELIGRNAFDFVHPDDRAEAGRSLGLLISSPAGVRVVTMRHLHRDGSYRTLESSGTNLTHVPAVGGIVVNSRDVTERRRLEDQLSQSQRLESVGRLAGGMAHDVNNILTAILANADLLSMTVAPEAPEQEELGEIVRSSLRARDLVQQLLAFARRQVLTPKVLDLNRSVRESERLLRRLLRTDIVLRLQLSEELWPVLADPAQVEQVLINLALNARDAMPKGGTLTIDTANVDLDDRHARAHAGAAERGPHVLLAVSDTGLGMPPDVLAHVFEPFFTTKAPGLGTGLGLATTYGIVRQTGGQIYATSSLGSGSRFEIYLPPALAPVAPAAAPAPASARGGTETVMLVEDDEAVASVGRRALERAGYRVLAAETPEAALALEAATDDPIHLLVTDMVMPGMSGTEVAELLCRRRPGLPVLYISGYSEHLGAAESDARFLPKPFTAQAFVAKVREVLDAG